MTYIYDSYYVVVNPADLRPAPTHRAPHDAVAGSKGRPYSIIVPDGTLLAALCNYPSSRAARTLPPYLIGNPVAKAAAWCRAEQGDL
jgi:hypothetical protein